MNFYKHHLGDYAQATAHLTFIEDAAYSRLIRKYYADERPIPADIKAAQRLVGARTREEKEAVQTVLEEFFELQDDGWHNKRCDAELEKANAQAETNRRIAEEREARKRERLQHDQSTNRDTDRATNRQPSQTPDTRHQTPDTIVPNGTVNTSQSSTASPPTTSEGLLPGIDLSPTKTGIPDCPQQDIRKLWAELMPELQQPAKWTDARAAVLRTRWREEATEHRWSTADDGLRFFAKLFRWCRQSPFLMGKAQSRTPGQAPFSLTLPWLIKSENWAKVQEGNFHPEN